MPYYDNQDWFIKDPKNFDEDSWRSKVVKHAKGLHERLKNFRGDASRYFEIVEYKNYSETSEQKLFRDKSNEDDILTYPFLTLNVTSSCIETACNKVAKTKPKVTFVTKGASRERREIAHLLDKYVLKMFKHGGLWKLASGAFKSACICGLGIIKVVIKDSKVMFHKIPIFEFFCDNALTGPNKPTEAGEIKNLSFYNLKKMFPNKADALEEEYGQDKLIPVVEIYKEYERHVITTEKVLLVDEKWEKPLPYKFQKWEESDQGVISVGIAKKLQSIHSAITYILGKTFTSIRNFAVPRIFLPKESDPDAKDISNLVGQVIEINTQEGGQIPQFSTPPPMNKQVIEILLMLWQKAFEILGVSQMSASGQIPRGLEKASGAALRSYQNIESERFQLIRSDYENFFIDITKLVFKIIPDSMLPKGVKRADIEEMQEDALIFTSSLLPETPAGKLAMVTDIFNTGLVSQAQALDLLDSPDVTAYAKSETARLRAVELIIDRALEKNQVPVFHQPLGLDLYLDRARKRYATLIIEEPESEDKIELLGSFLVDLEQKVSAQVGLQNALDASAQAGGAPAGGIERRIDIRAQG